MDFLPIYTKYIEAELSALNLPTTPQSLYEPISYFLKIGGKRIRPILTLLGAEMFGLKKEQAIHAAIAIELLHNFSLVHDDIMDKAPLRRGQETVHQKWNLNVAILSGDAIFIKAYEHLQQQEGDLREILKTFNQAAIEICEGQQMDMDFESQEDISIDDYIQMIRLKTSVLLGCALEMAAIIAGCDEQDRKHCYDFGVNIGLSFQIQDDILDLYGDPEKFGKQIGGDVIENKKTILYLLAKKHANNKQLIELHSIKNELDNIRKIERTKILFETLNVKQLAEDVANNYFNNALAHLHQIQVNIENKLHLSQLSNFLLNRNH
ncbi:MAG TPA: polyprenyl synthetase family protein [Taishania sp.]|nr:polyprenyl synthetase family protein [Taishania sp.]HNS41857.1 polyprenyl synthetase family protein [Taishania sp.]